MRRLDENELIATARCRRRGPHRLPHCQAPQVTGRILAQEQLATKTFLIGHRLRLPLRVRLSARSITVRSIREGSSMERFIADLVKNYESGKVDRREFCKTVALAASVYAAGDAATAQAPRGFKMIGINH